MRQRARGLGFDTQHDLAACLHHFAPIVIIHGPFLMTQRSPMARGIINSSERILQYLAERYAFPYLDE
jgi:hypothetical protein